MGIQTNPSPLIIGKDFLQNLSFVKPFTHSKSTGKVVFYTGVDKPGIFFIKRIDTGVITTVKKCTFSMRHAANRSYLRLKKLGIETVFAFIALPAPEIDQFYDTLRQMLKNTPHHDQYEKIWPYIHSQQEVPENILSFENIKSIGFRTQTWTFVKYRYKAGVYLIKEITESGSEIVYVGRSIHGLGKRICSHFRKHSKERKSPYRVCYADTKNIYEYEISVIEIPVLEYESRGQQSEVTGIIEKALIKQLNPRDNKMSKSDLQEMLEKIPIIEEDKTDYF